MHVRQDQRKRNTKEERDTAAGKPGRLRPKTQASKKRAHPDTATRKSARRNREISGNVKSAENNPCLNAKTIPHTNRPAFFLTDCLPIYSSRKKW